tara:strand:- start:3547 stop:4716 length:1170 start_codon:yes stop_codon:yes gene_type:complete
MLQLSELSHSLVGQEMFQILAQAQEMEREGREVLHFEIGEPDFRTPENISEAAIAAIQGGDTHYTNSMGLHEFRREAILATERSRGFRPDLEQILVTPGANVQIYLAIACSVNPGEEVIIPDPGFVSYASIAKSLGAIPVRVKLHEKNGFRMDPMDVSDLITPKTRMLIMNSPSNPTGAVATEEEILQLYELAMANGIYLLSDEIYTRMIYNESEVGFCSPSRYDECRTNCILVNGFSKSYAMTGWRLGVVTGPQALIRKMGLLLETTLSCTSPFIQRAGIEALRGSQKEIEKMVEAYRNRRDQLIDGLNSIPGFRCSRPGGAFYAFPNITATGYSSEELAKRLMFDLGIIVSPGTIFGKFGEGFIRLCYATSEQNIERALDKMDEYFS